jgi:hypothetical protein
MLRELSFRNDRETTMCCVICGTTFRPVGRQRFDKPACRQAAWRRRHPIPFPSVPARVTRHRTVYQCPVCESRYLGEQFCADCAQFCRRVGAGGPCPACDEPVAIIDLLPEGAPPA